MDMSRFRNLSADKRALVALAVLLDGREAAIYLENDSSSGATLKDAAADLAGLDVELRMSYAGTMLRAALEELGVQRAEEI